LTEVVPYYALKQRRQQLGFEGPDVEVKKRQDIITRSKVYVKADIVQESESRFLVPSKSDPSKVYEVDLETYTCNCLDYPLIKYCKHLCAVQELFDEPGSPSGGAPQATPEVPCLSSLPSNPVQAPPTPTQPKNRILTVMEEKLECLAARLRRPWAKDSQPGALDQLEAVLDAMLLDTDNRNVLPSAVHLPPNKSSSWAQTHASMMPGVKTKRKPLGDPAYGGGASSGNKAPKLKAKAKYVNIYLHCFPFRLSSSILQVNSSSRCIPISPIPSYSNSSSPPSSPTPLSTLLSPTHYAICSPDTRNVLSLARVRRLSRAFDIRCSAYLILLIIYIFVTSFVWYGLPNEERRPGSDLAN
jgi:hypothetical protein